MKKEERKRREKKGGMSGKANPWGGREGNKKEKECKVNPYVPFCEKGENSKSPFREGEYRPKKGSPF